MRKPDDGPVPHLPHPKTMIRLRPALLKPGPDEATACGGCGLDKDRPQGGPFHHRM